MKDTTLKQLVRDRNGDPRGMVIATVIDNTIRFGWSYTILGPVIVSISKRHLLLQLAVPRRVGEPMLMFRTVLVRFLVKWLTVLFVITRVFPSLNFCR